MHFRVVFVLCCLHAIQSFRLLLSNRVKAKQDNILKMSLSKSDTTNLEKCLRREYTTFFSPFERDFYAQDVKFIDPLTNFEGIDKYQNNVDLLAGRTTLGSILFKDASINLHNIEKLDDGKLLTRWSLRFTFRILPHQPTARFSGVSIYTLNENGKVKRQEDYWDSVNLKSGRYEQQSFAEGLGDFLQQLKDSKGADMAAPELPYELLRRAKQYEIRRYPATTVAQTKYDQRPEGYDRLGSYAGGSNENQAKLEFFSPTIMKIVDVDGVRSKVMTWPLAFAPPGGESPDPSVFPDPTIPRIIVTKSPSVVVAVRRFEIAATEPVVKAYTSQLLKDLESDGLVPSPAAKNGEEYFVGQYDALFSLNKRRVEVWVQLDRHPWI